MGMERTDEGLCVRIVKAMIFPIRVGKDKTLQVGERNGPENGENLLERRGFVGSYSCCIGDLFC
jgi:hypothetical protein